jgi:predicted  nucleic acid-binding Zn-ribbon protein
MVEKKRVRFANNTGKPLVTVREINAVGRGTKLTPLVRKSTPADLKKMKAKHEAALRRAMADVSRAEDNLNQKKEVAANVRKIQMQAKLQLAKEKNPAAIKNLKEKINKMNGHMKTIAPHIENSQLAVNLAKNKLKAQKAHGIKKSRFSFM